MAPKIPVAACQGRRSEFISYRAGGQAVRFTPESRHREAQMSAKCQ